MSRQAYPYPAPAPRHMSNHSTSSAFSSSANPDEDWTKISDLAERRRIQNRIAQRNYRKKLKRRLEDLERRAGSSSASPPQTPAELQQPERNDQEQQFRRSPESLHRPLSPRLLPSQYTPPMHSDDELLFSQNFERESSRSPQPPLFAYHSYPAPEEVSYPQYQNPHPYRMMPSMGDRPNPYDSYMAQEPVTLPSMLHFQDSIKRENEDTLSPTISPYNMTYQSLPAIDIHLHHNGYEHPNPHTPPLSHSFEHSSTSSESGYHYPHTPLSMSPS